MDADTATATEHGNGVVLAFPTDRARPPEKLSCTNCYHMTMGSQGLYCTFFREWIIFDYVAEECGEYEEDR